MPRNRQPFIHSPERWPKRRREIHRDLQIQKEQCHKCFTKKLDLRCCSNWSSISQALQKVVSDPLKVIAVSNCYWLSLAVWKWPEIPSKICPLGGGLSTCLHCSLYCRKPACARGGDRQTHCSNGEHQHKAELAWAGALSHGALQEPLCLQVYLMGEDRSHVQLAGNQKVLPLSRKRWHKI